MARNQKKKKGTPAKKKQHQKSYVSLNIKICIHTRIYTPSAGSSVHSKVHSRYKDASDLYDVLDFYTRDTSPCCVLCICLFISHENSRAQINSYMYPLIFEMYIYRKRDLTRRFCVVLYKQTSLKGLSQIDCCFF